MTNTTPKELKVLPDALFNHIYSYYENDDKDYNSEEFMNFLRNNKEYINEIFNVASSLEEMSEKVVLLMIELGLQLNQSFSGMDGEFNNCIFAVHCAEFQQLDTITIMLKNGLHIPSYKELVHENNIIEALILGCEKEYINDKVFLYINDKLFNYPIHLSYMCRQKINDDPNVGNNIYIDSLISFLLRAMGNQDKELKVYELDDENEENKYWVNNSRNQLQ
jgi:hypothetical protein